MGVEVYKVVVLKAHNSHVGRRKAPDITIFVGANHPFEAEKKVRKFIKGIKKHRIIEVSPVANLEQIKQGY